MSDFKFEAWPTEFRSINQYFGANPQNYAQFGLPGHEGLDIMAPDGSKVFCVAPGVVFSVRHELTGHNYGAHVRVNHQDGWQTTYAHLKQCLVSPGQPVQAGSLLGLADNSGNSFGSHLHLTLKKLGAAYLNWPHNIHDPTPFILPLLGWARPAGPYQSGWASLTGLTLGNGLGQANAGGLNLRIEASINAPKIALIPAGTIFIINGPARGQFVPVDVPLAALGLPDPTPPPAPAPPPPATAATVDGWGFADYLSVSGDQAVVGQVGINLRAQPERTAHNIGLVRGGSTVSLTGARQGEYLPVRVRQSDFNGAISLPDVPPPPPSGSGGQPPANLLLGWAWTQNLAISGRQAIVGALGINLRAAASQGSARLGLLKEGAVASVVGLARGEYTPVWARKADVLELASPLPVVSQPDPFPAGAEPPPPAEPVPDSTPGWVFTSQIVTSGTAVEAGMYGLNLRDGPRRDARAIGFVPAGASLIITGPAQGEYTPVRVDDRVLQPPFGTAAPAGASAAGLPPVLPAEGPLPTNVDPPALGNCRIGLHASADPFISDDEIREFADLRPGIIKVLSFHGAAEIGRLAAQHPDAAWIVRPFVAFDGRVISPDQFITDTINDVRRALDVLAGKDVIIELHNEPNVTDDGLGTTWSDGAAFAAWWLELLGKYRQVLPGMRFIYPGLSPGSTVAGVKQDHIQFLEASRAAVEAADGLGVHIYWSAVYPMRTALGVLDDYISRFRFKPIWVTEASNNKAGTSVSLKSQQYLQFWKELQERPTVQGVTYFVAWASNPAFGEEIWVGRGIGALVGRR
jgi:hypothetical protein